MPFLGARGRGTQEPKEWLVTKEWLVIKEWLVSCSTLSTAICSSRLILLQNESGSDTVCADRRLNSTLDTNSLQRDRGLHCNPNDALTHTATPAWGE